MRGNTFFVVQCRPNCIGLNYITFWLFILEERSASIFQRVVPNALTVRLWSVWWIQILLPVHPTDKHLGCLRMHWFLHSSSFKISRCKSPLSITTFSFKIHFKENALKTNYFINEYSIMLHNVNSYNWWQIVKVSVAQSHPCRTEQTCMMTIYGFDHNDTNKKAGNTKKQRETRGI